MEYSLMTWIKRFGGVTLLAALVALSPTPATAQENEDAEAASEAPAAEAMTDEATTEEAMTEEAPAEEVMAPLTGEVDLSGSWTLNVGTPDGAELETKLTFTETDGVVSALLETDLGDLDVDEVMIDGNNIEFSAELDMGGILAPLGFAGTIGGDAIQGELTLEFEGAEPMVMPVTGFRNVVGLTGEVDLVGTWTLSVELPDGSVSESALTVTEEDGSLVALIETELGEARIDGISVDGNAISFETQLDMGGVFIPLSFEGTSGGDQLEGVVKLDFEGQAMEMPMSGTKDGAGGLTGPVNLLGSWDIEAELPDGSVSSSAMTVVEEDGKLVAILETEIGEARIDNMVIDGNSVSYETSIDMGGMLIPLTFVGSTGGDALEGVISLDMDGQKMELPITGTRVVEVAAEEMPAEEVAAEEGATEEMAAEETASAE